MSISEPGFSESMIQLDVTAGDWREAIQTAADPLVTAGYIRESYVAAMERVMEEMGPYFVIVPGVALAHARPEGRVLRSAISLCRLAEPVVFGHADNDPVWLVLVLAGSSDDSHLGLLAKLAAFLGDPLALEAVRTAGSPGEVAAVLNGFLGREVNP